MAAPACGIPCIDDDAGDGIADDVGAAAAHVQQLVDGEHEQNPRFRQIEIGQRRQDYHDGGTRHSGHAFRRHHHQPEQRELLAERERDAVGLCDEHAGEGAVHHRAVEIERVAERQHEAGDVARDGELRELLQHLRIGRFGAGGGEGKQHRLAHGAEQGAGAPAHDQEGDEEQQRPQHRQRDIESAHEFRVGEQDAGALPGNAEASAANTTSGASSIT